jgi:hypothetical protein
MYRRSLPPFICRRILMDDCDVALATDRTVSDHLPESNTQLRVSRWASRAGADYTICPLTALFYFYGKADNNPRARDAARIGIEALADAEITVNVLKAITQRPRPETKKHQPWFLGRRRRIPIRAFDPAVGTCPSRCSRIPGASNLPHSGLWTGVHR